MLALQLKGQNPENTELPGQFFTVNWQLLVRNLLLSHTT